MESPFPYSRIVRIDRPFRAKEVGEANVFSKEYRVINSWERSDYFESIPEIFKIQSESIVVEDFLLKEPLELKLIIDDHGFQTKNIILSWPRDRTIVREIELPGSNIKELKESLSCQLDSFILFPEDEVYYDIHPSHSAEYGEKVFIFAIKKEELDDILLKLESSNLKPDRVIISPLSYIPLVNDDKVAVIEKCEDRYTFNLYVDKTLVSTSLVRNKDSLKSKILENMPDDVTLLGCEQDVIMIY